ncbi:hypothetical protein N8642_03835, partial [bacterium]|nr:hypothetical protein [bacterium]
MNQTEPIRHINLPGNAAGDSDFIIEISTDGNFSTLRHTRFPPVTDIHFEQHHTSFSPVPESAATVIV